MTSSSSFSPLAQHILSQIPSGSVPVALLAVAINSLPKAFSYEEINTSLLVSKQIEYSVRPLIANQRKREMRKERRWNSKTREMEEFVDDRSRLFHAVEKCDTARVLQLLEVGADLSLETIHKESVLRKACHKGAEMPAEIVKALLAAHPWSEEEVYGCLSSGTYFGIRAEVAAALIPYCENKLKEPKEYEMTPLHWTCRAGMDHTIIPLLMAVNPDLAKAKCVHYHQTPLHLALLHNLPLPVIKMLVEPVPETIHIKDYKGGTPLYYTMEPEDRSRRFLVDLELNSQIHAYFRSLPL
jgi:hypothetical protein